MGESGPVCELGIRNINQSVSFSQTMQIYSEAPHLKGKFLLLKEHGDQVLVAEYENFQSIWDETWPKAGWNQFRRAIQQLCEQFIKQTV